jgi:hypothetical protein
MDNVVFLMSGTILGCILRHCRSLDKQLTILDRMIQRLPADDTLTEMRDARIARLASVQAFGFAVVEAAETVAETYGVHPWEVPMALSRDEWLSISPPIPTEWEINR